MVWSNNQPLTGSGSYLTEQVRQTINSTKWSNIRALTDSTDKPSQMTGEEFNLT